MHALLAIALALILWTYYAIEFGKWWHAKYGADAEALRDARETIAKLMERRSRMELDCDSEFSSRVILKMCHSCERWMWSADTICPHCGSFEEYCPGMTVYPTEEQRAIGPEELSRRGDRDRQK